VVAPVVVERVTFVEVAVVSFTITEGNTHPGLGPIVSSLAHEGIHGLDLAALIHDLQALEFAHGDRGDDGQPPPVTGGGQGQQGSGSGQTPSPGPVSQPPTTPGESSQPPVTSSSSDSSSTPDRAPTPSSTETAPSSSETTTLVSSSSPPTTAAETIRPAERPVVTPAATPVAVLSSVTVAPEAGRPVAVTPRPAEGGARLVALNAPGHELAVNADSLTGGSAQPELLFIIPRRAVDGGSRAEPARAPGVRETPRAADPQPGGTSRAEVPAPAGGTEQAPQPDAGPQEADLLTDVPGAGLKGLHLGAQQAYRRLRNVLGDLADSVTVWRLAPLLAAALVGGAAFGVARRRRRKRLGLRPVPPALTKDTDTWLPAPTEPPPADAR
jgi:hypothetical protein